MNREIKFRGKPANKVDGVFKSDWYYGFLTPASTILGESYAICESKISEWWEFEANEVVAETIGQFTGLYDKNGTPIYEGDIVRYWNQDTRCINPDCDAFNWIYDSFIKKVEGVVSYEDGMFVCEDYTPLCWCGFQNLEELRNDLNVTEEDEWMDCDGNVIDESVLGIEVIGNIYDNKDL